MRKTMIEKTDAALKALEKRLRNVAQSEGLSFSEMAALTDRELMTMPNLGRKAIALLRSTHGGARPTTADQLGVADHVFDLAVAKVVEWKASDEPPERLVGAILSLVNIRKST